MALFLTPAALRQNNTILTAVSVCDFRFYCILSHILVDIKICGLISAPGQQSFIFALAAQLSRAA